MCVPRLLTHRTSGGRRMSWRSKWSRRMMRETRFCKRSVTPNPTSEVVELRIVVTMASAEVCLGVGGPSCRFIRTSTSRVGTINLYCKGIHAVTCSATKQSLSVYCHPCLSRNLTSRSMIWDAWVTLHC